MWMISSENLSENSNKTHLEKPLNFMELMCFRSWLQMQTAIHLDDLWRKTLK